MISHGSKRMARSPGFAVLALPVWKINCATLLWPDQRHLDLALFSFRFSCMLSLLLKVFSSMRRIFGWYAWSPSKTSQNEAELKIRWLPAWPSLVGGLRCFDWSDDGIYQSGVYVFDPRGGSHDHASIRITGCGRLNFLLDLYVLGFSAPMGIYLSAA